MATSRLKILAKLSLLLGLPVLLLAGLFGTGVYLGHQNRYAVTKFERDWFGMEVDVPPKPPEEPKVSEPEAGGTEPAPTPPTDAAVPAPEPAGDPGAKPTPEPAPPAAEPAPTPEPNPDGSPTPPPTEPAADPAPQPAGDTPTPPAAVLTTDMQKQLAMPATVSVKVLVDQELVAAHPDWVDYVQRVVSMTSLTYQEQFGITVELWSVGRWPVATAGLDSDALMADLKGRSREGADVLMGFTNRPLDGDIAGQSETPAGESPFNGAHGVVYATPGQKNPHLRTFLHELGHVYGAADVTDPAHPDYKAGSWMSYAPVAPGQTPWVDATNRAQILGRKNRPFPPQKGAPAPSAQEKPHG